MARPSVVALALATSAGLLPACDGQLVNLGASEALIGEGTRWQLLDAPLLPQVDGLLLANPSLTKQGELFFSAQERGTSGGEPKPTGVLRALPSGDGYGPAVALSFAGLESPDIASPAVAWSGTELWFAMSVNGSTDVFRCSLQAGACGAPQRVAELSSGYDDAPRPPLGETLMALSSKRHGSPLYQIYLASRASADAAWGAPSQTGLGRVNSAAFQSADGFLAEDGLALYFSSTERGTSDLYVARRATLQEAFGAPSPLSELNTDAEERMPWLSADADELYFVSNRPTSQYAQYALYVARKL